MSKINQKEYLKKYLSGDKKKRRKKNEPQVEKTRVKIIDDDVDVVKSSFNYDDDIILTGEDAPQIVGIIDDRPPELKTIEDFRSSGKWKSVSKTGEDGVRKGKSQKEFRKRNDFSPERIQNFNSRSKSTLNRHDAVKASDDDYSPPRKSRVPKRVGMSTDSPPKARSKRDSDDYSPPRKSKKYQSPSPARSEKDGDFSPPRKQGFKNAITGHISRESRPHKYSDEDLSPKRKVRRDSGSDYSPPRRKKDEKSNGPKQSRWSEPEKNHSHRERSSRQSQSSDFSPQRRRKENEDGRDKRHSSQYKSHGSAQRENSRSSHRRRSEDLSPRRNDSKRKNSTTVPRGNVGDGDDISPQRKSYTNERERKEKPSPEENDKLKPSRTLDGKKAGLQDAKLLKEETDKFRKREDELFKKMSSEVSGKDADIVVRNRRVKSAAELQKEEEKERERNKREHEKQEAYNRWGVGLKQIENYKTKVAEEIHESSKPLARYSDDADLDEMLKKQERQGDPMLQYIREKN